MTQPGSKYRTFQLLRFLYAPSQAINNSSQSNHQWNLSPHVLLFPVLELHANWIAQYICFGAWLSVMVISFIHAVVSVVHSFSLSCTISFMNLPQFIRSTVDGHQADFTCLAFVSSEFVHTFFWGRGAWAFLLAIYPGIELLGQRVMDVGVEPWIFLLHDYP